LVCIGIPKKRLGQMCRMSPTRGKQTPLALPWRINAVGENLAAHRQETGEPFDAVRRDLGDHRLDPREFQRR
jgi:hypothetical protein